MKILHLLASPAWSGPAENVALLAQAQRALGHEVSVAIDRKRTHVGAEELAAPRFAERGLLDEGGLELSTKSSPWAMLRDVLALSRRRVDVVHAHFSHDHLLARVGRPRGARLVRSIHAPRSLRWSLPAADAFTVPCEADAKKVPGRRALVLPALIDPAFRPSADRAALRRELNLPGNPLVGMLSTFQASRRHEVGLRAFARLRERQPEATLALVGDGVLEGAIRAEVARLGLSTGVRFAGYQKGADFVRWVQALDEVWVLGLGNDFSARVAAQARACGARVVAVDEGALPTFADALVAPEPDAVAAAACTPTRRPCEPRSNEEVARAVLSLYGADPAPAEATS